MIDPASPVPQPLVPAPPGAPAASADPFAQVLAAAAVRADPLGGADAPVPELLVPEAPEGDDADAQQRHARMFNQTGFFGNATSSGAELERAAAHVEPFELRSEAEPAVSGPAPPVGGAAASPARPASPAAAPAQPRGPHGPAPATARATGLAGASAPTAEPRARAVPRSATRPAPPPSRNRPPARASTGVAVAIRELEAGLEVIARVTALADGERGALHDAIAALLAEHGIVAGEIRIAAPARASASKGRTK